MSIPLMVRENTILPTSTKTGSADAPYAGEMLLKVYNLKEEAHSCVYQNEEKVAEVTLKKDGNKVTINSEAEYDYKLQFINKKVLNVSGTEDASVNGDGIITVAKGSTIIGIEVGID